MNAHCAGCSTTAGMAGCPEHGQRVVEPTSVTVPYTGTGNFNVIYCIHGIDLRLTPRCYLCDREPSHRQHEGAVDPERMAADFALLVGGAYPKTYPDLLALEADLCRFLREWSEKP